MHQTPVFKNNCENSEKQIESIFVNSNRLEFIYRWRVEKSSENAAEARQAVEEQEADQRVVARQHAAADAAHAPGRDVRVRHGAARPTGVFLFPSTLNSSSY